VVWGLVKRAKEIQSTAFSMPPVLIAAGVDASSASTWRLGEALSPHRRCSTTISMRLRPRRAARFPAGEIPGYRLRCRWSAALDISPSRGGLATPQYAGVGAQPPRILNAFDRWITVTQDLGAVSVPIFKNGQPFRGPLPMRQREFRRLLNVQDIPRTGLPHHRMRRQVNARVSGGRGWPTRR